MINKFLLAKHWQIFLVTVAIPFGAYILLMIAIFNNAMIHQNSEPALIFQYMKYFPLVMILFIFGLFGWFWSVAIGLQKKVPEGIKMKVTKFKIFFLVPTIYGFCFVSFMSFIISGISSGSDISLLDMMPGLMAIILPLHLFSMFGMLYSLYFIAKTIRTVELRRKVRFSDFAGEFFLLWFYPIGIWVLQPKINKFMEEAQEPTALP